MSNEPRGWVRWERALDDHPLCRRSSRYSDAERMLDLKLRADYTTREVYATAEELAYTWGCPRSSAEDWLRRGVRAGLFEFRRVGGNPREGRRLFLLDPTRDPVRNRQENRQDDRQEIRQEKPGAGLDNQHLGRQENRQDDRQEIRYETDKRTGNGIEELLEEEENSTLQRAGAKGGWTEDETAVFAALRDAGVDRGALKAGAKTERAALATLLKTYSVADVTDAVRGLAKHRIVTERGSPITLGLLVRLPNMMAESLQLGRRAAGSTNGAKAPETPGDAAERLRQTKLREWRARMTARVEKDADTPAVQAYRERAERSLEHKKHRAYFDAEAHAWDVEEAVRRWYGEDLGDRRPT